MWMGLLSRVWPYLAGAALLIGAGLYLRHTGYESGYAASEAKWQTLFAAAEKARDAANEKARRKEEDSTRISQTAEAEHAKTVASLTLRAADADKRIRALGLRIAAASACRVEVSTAPGSAAQPDGATESEQRASEAGGRVAAAGADCELDAAAKVEWQRFYTEVRSTINREN